MSIREKCSIIPRSSSHSDTILFPVHSYVEHFSKTTKPWYVGLPNRNSLPNAGIAVFVFSQLIAFLN